MCVYASSFATAIVLLSKLSGGGGGGNLNVYLTWLWLIPNWAYSTLSPFLCLCVSFIHHALFSPSFVPVCIFYSPCFIFSILCSEMTGRTIHHFLVEGEATTCLQLQDLWRKLISFCSLCIIWNYLYNVVPGYMQKKTSLDLRPSPCLPSPQFYVHDL